MQGEAAGSGGRGSASLDKNAATPGPHRVLSLRLLLRLAAAAAAAATTAGCCRRVTWPLRRGRGHPYLVAVLLFMLLFVKFGFYYFDDYFCFFG